MRQVLHWNQLQHFWHHRSGFWCSALNDILPQLHSPGSLPATDVIIKTLKYTVKNLFFTLMELLIGRWILHTYSKQLFAIRFALFGLLMLILFLLLPSSLLSYHYCCCCYYYYYYYFYYYYCYCYCYYYQYCDVAILTVLKHTYFEKENCDRSC